MKYESRAIALSYIKHGESSIIAKLFTEKKGLQSFIIKGVRSNKSKKKLGLFQPLELSIINATYLPKKNLQYLASINLSDSKKQNGKSLSKFDTRTQHILNQNICYQKNNRTQHIL